jgi:hypothetical protein
MILIRGTLLDQQLTPGVEYKNGKGPVQFWIFVGSDLFSSANHVIIFIHQNYILIIFPGFFHSPTSRSLGRYT